MHNVHTKVKFKVILHTVLSEVKSSCI